MSGSRDLSGLNRAAGAAPRVATLSRRNTARPLDAGTRSAMQTRFGHDFGSVRVHTGDEAGRSAQALEASAFTVGSDIVFGPGTYQPHTARGQHLLAHELAHVVQAGHRGTAPGAEERASGAAAQAMRGQAVSASQLGASGGGIHRQPKGEEPKASDDEAPVPEFKPFTLPWSLIAAQLPKLQPPSMLAPPAPTPIFQLPQLSPGGGAAAPAPAWASLKLSQLPPLPPVATRPGPLAPTLPRGFLSPTPAGGADASTPDLPSRIGLTDFGSMSLGLRFGLPVAPQPIPGTPPERRPQPPFQIPGSGPSALSVSDYRFELLDMSMTGKVPTGFEAVDKGDLIKAGFGIVAKYIAPDAIASLARKVSGKPGADYQLDFTITGDFKGGGITFFMPLGKPKRPTRASSSP